ncbi:hypothetical protein L596_029786 [Steinernema carpocapsae]|uniref:Uncharacterized protein n=1 Tax=Steinernema carpocapsae TaxID=34508 RepID=A0A4U5LQT9_STECR|nr:hypothetical protein L596_029786 [Steinernema carpocapsae]
MAHFELGCYVFLLLLTLESCLRIVRANEEYDGTTFLSEKRRIGLRLPNILHLSEPQQVMEKRRIGLRMPNIIYLRGPDEKKSSSSWWY